MLESVVCVVSSLVSVPCFLPFLLAGGLEVDLRLAGTGGGGNGLSHVSAGRICLCLNSHIPQAVQHVSDTELQQ